LFFPHNGLGVDPAIEHGIRDAYDAFLTGDFERLNAFFAPDAVYVNPSYAVESGTREGTAELSKVWLSLHEMFQFTEARVEEIQEGPEGVFVCCGCGVTGESAAHPRCSRRRTYSSFATGAQ
jgi:ketosteroid isomerase-like protein